MLPTGFEPIFPVSERLQTHALDYAATVIGLSFYNSLYFINNNDSLYKVNVKFSHNRPRWPKGVG